MKMIIIAIDGFSSCGKSTLAKSLAKKLSYVYIDTGAMYRAVTLYMLRNKIDPANLAESDLENILDQIEINFLFNENKGHSDTYLNGENVEEEIRGEEVSNEVSRISKVHTIRERMAHLQRGIGLKKGLVMDGRDIGTTIFPHAELKIFMTADPEIRAQRRFDEIQSKGGSTSMEKVKRNLELRDLDDVSRSESPLKKAEDAILLDNSTITEKQQLRLVLDWVAAAQAKQDI
mgnify:CR=1 FL=1